MRIIFVGGIQRKEDRDASRFFSTSNKLIHGLIRSGHQVLYFSDRDAKREAFFWNRRLNPNKRLLKKVKLYRPELIFFLHADLISLDTICEIKSLYPEVRMAQINLDPTFHPKNKIRLEKWHEHVNATFLTTHNNGLLSGNRTYFIPNPVDLSVESYRAFENNSQFDLFLAHGAYIDNQDPRKLTVDAIKANLPNLRFSYHYAPLNGGIWGHTYYQTLAQSRMGLNLTRHKEEKYTADSPNSLYLYSSDRLSQYMGNGLLIFTHKAHKLNELFEEDKEMVFYKDHAELIEKLSYYKHHDAQAREIAQIGWKKVHQEHSSTLVGQFMVDVLTNASTYDYQWPTAPF
jgi:hypothetical protein